MKDINLLPEEIKSTSTYTPTSTKTGSPVKIIVIGFLVLILIGATYIAPQFYIKALQVRLDSINKEIESEKYNPVREVNAKLDKINGLINSKGDVMDTIDTKAYPVNEVLISLNSVVPQGCTITKMSYASNKVAISGIAKDRMVVAEFIARVQRLEFLTTVGNVNIDGNNGFNISVQVGVKSASTEGKAGK